MKNSKQMLSREMWYRAAGLLLALFVAGCDAETHVASPENTPSFQGTLGSYDDINAMFRDDIERELLLEKKNLKRWADELERTAPQTPNDVWVTFNVSLRAGREETARKMLPLFAEMVEPLPLPHETEHRINLRNQLCYKIHDLSRSLLKAHPTVLRDFYETFDTVYCPTHFERDILRPLFKSNVLCAEWLNQRFQNALAHPPADEDRCPFEYPGLMSRVAQNWQYHYIDQLILMGTVKVEWERLNREASSTPEDMLKLELLFNSLIRGAAYRAERKESIPDLDWLIPTAEKRSAYHAWIIGQNVLRIQNDDYQKRHEIAELFLKQARENPLAAKECDDFRRELASMSSMVQPERSDEEIQQIFFVRVSDELNKTLLVLERNDEAQQVMEETREFRKEHGLPDSIGLAGMTQAASGARVVENEIKSRESTDENDPAYWMQRFGYYRGRQEIGEQEQALRRGLTLFATPESRDNRGGYSNFYRELFHFLRQNNRYDEAVALFEEHYALTQGEPGNRYSIIFYSTNTLLEIGRGSVVFPKLYNDLKEAVVWLNATPDSDERRNEKYVRFESLAFELLRTSDPPNRYRFYLDNRDSLYWEILSWSSAKATLEKLSERLLFPNANTTLDTEALKKAKALLAKPTTTPLILYALGKTLNQGSQSKEALPFLEEALTRWTEYPPVREYIEEQILQAALGIGDWERAEKLAIDRTDVAMLRKVAEGANKAGKTAIAKRTNRRLANLGISQ